MKKIGGLLLAIGLLSASLLTYIARSPMQVSAAGCANSKNYGAVRLYIPELPKKGQYQLWVRMQSPQNSGKVLVELNQAECFEVGSTVLRPNTWEWVPYYENNQNKTITISNTQGNMIELVGIQSSIKIDRVILTDPACAPENFGNNCAASVEPSLADTSGVQVIAPPSGQPVSGNVVLSSTPFTLASTLASLSYSAQGRTVQSFLTAEPFDTTLLENGKHTVLIESKLTDGAKVVESVAITVDNPETVLSPVMRWLRQQQQSLITVGLGLAALALIVMLIAVLRRWYIKRRQRHFHGF